MSHYYVNLEYGQSNGNANQRALFEALDAYSLLTRNGRLRRLWARIRRQPYTLWSLNSMSQQWQVQARYESGLQLVPVAAIRGSEGKESAFDSHFTPLHHRHSRERWLGIAMAHWQGQILPPVDLIKVDDGRSAVYFVRDGHHRVSVARAFGQREIEANVTVWQLNGPAPWNACEPSMQTAVPAADYSY
ncbi:MAG: hypothetical protein IAF02_03405 [Anaerolineae bacterium]|nr:hypothetical protein [Anaerolineae bacterium]